MQDIRLGDIDCVVVKDLSRFGRNYLEAGNYIEKIFPFLGVRFIAVSDDIDTGDKGNDTKQMASEIKNLFMGVRFIALGDHYDSREHSGTTIGIDTAFQTLLYDLYSKDVSVKVKASFKNKCANGEYVFGQVPFGYRKSKNERNTVIVDEKEAEVVRYIYALAAGGDTSGNNAFGDNGVQGMSSTEIAEQLKKEGIPTITQMRKPDKKAEERKVIPNHHEALITPEIFAQVSKFRPDISIKKKDAAKQGRGKNPLTGKLYCGGCGYAMVYKPQQGKISVDVSNATSIPCLRYQSAAPILMRIHSKNWY